MKVSHTIIAAIIAFLPITANAAIVNYGDPITGGGENITLSKAVQSGQSGTIFTSPNAENGGFHASLGNNHTITFSYNFSSATNFTYGSPQVRVQSGTLEDFYNGRPSAFATSFGLGKYNYQSSAIFATANIYELGGETSITNNSGGDIPVSSFFGGLLEQVSNGVGGTVGQINYNVSAVPLPASVVMFGSAVAAMFGFASLSRQRKGTILQA